MERTSMLFAPAIFALTLSASIYSQEAAVTEPAAPLQAAEVQQPAAMGMASLKRWK